MIPCINQATVMKTDTILFIQSAGRHGFPQVELDIDRLEAGIKKDGLPKIRSALRDSTVEVVSLNAIDNYPIMAEDEMASSLRRAEEVLQLCEKVDSRILVVNPANFKSPKTEKDVERRFDFFFNRVCDLSEKHDVTLGYEYVSYDDKVINNLNKTIAGFQRWNANAKLVLDVFHMYRNKETIEELPPDLTDRLVAFHVNDAPSNISVEKVVDTDRIFPLDGIIGVQNYIVELQRRNYNGPVSVELFNQKYWTMDVDEVVQSAKESLDKLLIF